MTSSFPGSNLIADTMAVVLWLEQRRLPPQEIRRVIAGVKQAIVVEGEGCRTGTRRSEGVARPAMRRRFETGG